MAVTNISDFFAGIGIDVDVRELDNLIKKLSSFEKSLDRIGKNKAFEKLISTTKSINSQLKDSAKYQNNLDKEVSSTGKTKEQIYNQEIKRLRVVGQLQNIVNKANTLGIKPLVKQSNSLENLKLQYHQIKNKVDQVSSAKRSESLSDKQSLKIAQQKVKQYDTETTRLRALNQLNKATNQAKKYGLKVSVNQNSTLQSIKRQYVEIEGKLQVLKSQQRELSEQAKKQLYLKKQQKQEAAAKLSKERAETREANKLAAEYERGSKRLRDAKEIIQTLKHRMSLYGTATEKTNKALYKMKSTLRANDVLSRKQLESIQRLSREANRTMQIERKRLETNKQIYRWITKQNTGISSVSGSLGSMVAAIGSVYTVIDQLRNVKETAKTFQGVEIGYQLTFGEETGNKILTELTNFSNEVGVELKQTLMGARSFLAVAESTMGRQQAIDAFKSINIIAKATGTTQDSLNRALVGFSQLQTGEFAQSQELRQQIAENIPALVKFIAPKFFKDLSEDEAIKAFKKGMKDNSLAVEKINKAIIEAAAELQKTVAFDKMTKNLESNENRMINSFTRSYKAVAMGTKEANGAMAGMSGLFETVTVIMTNWETEFKDLGDALGLGFLYLRRSLLEAAIFYDNNKESIKKMFSYLGDAIELYLISKLVLMTVKFGTSVAAMIAFTASVVKATTRLAGLGLGGGLGNKRKGLSTAAKVAGATAVTDVGISATSSLAGTWFAPAITAIQTGLQGITGTGIALESFAKDIGAVERDPQYESWFDRAMESFLPIPQADLIPITPVIPSQSNGSKSIKAEIKVDVTASNVADGTTAEDIGEQIDQKITEGFEKMVRESNVD